jgi:hypothetical protein
MKLSFKSFILGFACAAISLGAVTYANASSNSTLKACAHKKTGAMRYISKGSCKKTETTLSWSQLGPQGPVGAKGEKGETGPSGASGNVGPAGSSSPTGFTPRSVCGVNGNSLCTVGEQGPGGGTIFFVDTNNEISQYDYLEVAPSNSCQYVCTWATTALKCGTSANQDCQASFISDAGDALNYVSLGTGKDATSLIVARHQAAAVTKTLYAAGSADAYTTSKASDWWLPSKAELNELCKFARNQPTGNPAITCSSEGTLRTGFTSDYFWSSTEGSWADATIQGFGDGNQSIDTKSNNFTFLARAIRGF